MRMGEDRADHLLPGPVQSSMISALPLWLSDYKAFVRRLKVARKQNVHRFMPGEVVLTGCAGGVWSVVD